MNNSRIDRLRPHLPLLLLLIATIATFGRITGHDFIFNWDDNRYVVENTAIQGFSFQHLREVFTSYYVGNYAPVQMLSYMLDYGLWGLRAGGFLFTNIIIHAASGLLFYQLLMRWHGDRLLALVAAALFLIHPVQVESVAWVSQRKNLLAMFFFLLAWHGYCRYRDAEVGAGRLAYLVSVVAFVAALLAKSVAVIFPVVLVLHDFCFMDEGRRLRLKDKVPFLLAAAVVAEVALYSQQAELGGGRADFYGGSPLATFYTMLPVFCRYLGMLIWPFGLSAVYAPSIHQTIDPTVAGAALLLAGMAFGGWHLFKRDRRLGFWWVFFFIGLLPVSQIVPLVTLMNDRYLYFPMLGVAALAGAGAVFLRNRFRTRPALPSAMLVFLLFLLSIITFLRAGVWHDSLALWNDAVIKSPTASYAWSSLAEVYFRDLRVDESIHAYEHSLELDPKNKMAIAALGPMYTELGELDKGYAMLTKFLKLQPRDVKGWAYLGINYMQRGEYVEAEKMYKKALAIKPDSKKVLILLGGLALQRRLFGQARSYFSQAERIGANDPETAFRLACVASLSGRSEEALGWLEKALERGYRDFGNLYDNKELSALWNEPRYTMLMQRYFPEMYQGR